MKKRLFVALILIVKFSHAFTQQCNSANTPILGLDTTIYLPCSKDIVDLTMLYNTAGLSVQWDIVTPTFAGIGYHWLIAANTLTGCKDTAYITVKQNVKKWLGTVDNNWHNPANWSDQQVPTSKSHVIIYGGYPECIISDSDAVAASVRILEDGVYEIRRDRKLSILSSCDTLPPYFEAGDRTIIIDNPTSQIIQSIDSSQIISGGIRINCKALTHLTSLFVEWQKMHPMVF